MTSPPDKGDLGGWVFHMACLSRVSCTVSRVRATSPISFMAVACIRHLMYRIKRQHKALSPEVIRNTLIHVQHSVFKHKRTQKRYVMPAQINPEAKKIYAVMGLKATTTAYPLY